MDADNACPLRTALVVLGAGAGSRFVGPTHKLRAIVRGRTVLSWSIEAALRSEVGPLAVVSRDDSLADLIPVGVTLLRNERWSEGIATSLQVAVQWAKGFGADALVVGLGDQPFVGAQSWRAVAGATQRPIAIATYGASRRNPVRLAASVWPLLPSAGDEGARSLIREHPNMVSELPCEGEPGDIDTVEDLQTWS